MTNLNYTPTAMRSSPEEVAQAIVDLTHHIHTVMGKHVLVLERSEQTTATLFSQLLQVQADNAVLNAKLHEAELLAPKLREAEEARDLAMERCKKAVDELNSTKLEMRNYLLEHHNSCHSSAPPPVSTRTTKPLRDRGIVLKTAAFRIRTSRDDDKSGEVISDPSAK